MARSYIKHLSDAVGMLVEDHENDAYDIPPLDAPVATVAIGLDGTCMLLCEDGWREAMCGTISLYDGNGHRQYTIYTAAAPEYGKATFLARLTQEIAAVKQRYPFASYIGVADGAKENWQFLRKHTDFQLLDFYHLSEYVSGAALALRNNRSLMCYSKAVKADWPIGSGVTEAACKTLVKQRLCCSGMRWKYESAAIVLGIRPLPKPKAGGVSSGTEL